MTTHQRFPFLFVAAVLIIGSTASLADESKQKDSASSEVEAATAKKQALAWIADYRKKQVLFHDEDIARVQKRLQADSPEEASKWWSKTADMREALESPEWQVTRQWFKEFLKVQAIYSDKQIEQFREETKVAAEADATADFKAMLAKIETMRSNLIKESAGSKAVREQQLSVLNAYRQQEATERMQAGAHTAAKTDTVSRPVTIRAPRYAPAPLIDSMDAARASIIRGFWGY